MKFYVYKHVTNNPVRREWFEIAIEDDEQIIAFLDIVKAERLRDELNAAIEELRGKQC